MTLSRYSPRIAHLADVPHLAPVLDDWFVCAWPDWYGPGGRGDAGTDLAACVRRDALPLCLVALDGACAPLGTVSLKADGLGADVARGPWLAALLVEPSSRRRGIATALVAALEAHARGLGFDALFATTGTAQGLLERRGWTIAAHAHSPRGTLPVYTVPLATV